jgi:hypothetical protein
MNFRWSHDKRHVYTHDPPRNTVDRIDRSFSPRGGREEREPSIESKNRTAVRRSKRILKKQRRHPFIAAGTGGA